MTRLALEVAVDSVAGLRIAREHGADRVELCTALELGGLTPSRGLIEAAVSLRLPVEVLIRCRPGDFQFDEDDIAVMERDITAAVLAGVEGVVIGALTPEHRLDRRAVERMVGAARSARSDVAVTFHRAVDWSPRPVELVEQLVLLGVDRVLTSGGASRAIDGLTVISRLSSSGLEIMAGGGVTVQDVAALVEAGASAIHTSAKARVVSNDSSAIPLGAFDDMGRFMTDAAIVAQFRLALEAVT